MSHKGFLVRAATRKTIANWPSGIESVQVSDLAPNTNWSVALTDVYAVIHCSARVHVLRDSANNPRAEFLFTNTKGTKQLASQAAAAGVKRFVFMSTVGVHGDNSGDSPFLETDTPYPHNHYSYSKYEAEKVLWYISHETGMEVTVIRAPLVYGPSNPGNFLSLLHVVSKGIPLPLASTTNKRSFIYVGNLADALTICAVHPAAAGKTYLVSDGEDVSTPELIRSTAAALGVSARLFSFPPFLIQLGGALLGKSAAVNRLTGSLVIDSSKIKRELGWKPPFTMKDGLQETAKWYLNTSKHYETSF